MKKFYILVMFASFSGIAQITQVSNIFPENTAVTPVVINSSIPNNFFDFNGTLLFRANNGVNGVELWKSDGTSAGTSMVRDINTLSTVPNSNPNNLTLFQGNVFFSATTGTTAPGTGSELYRTDGTLAGTTLVTDLNPGTANGNPINFTVLNASTLMFAANNGTSGSELFKTDGTAAGTVNVFDFAGATNSPSWIENLAGTAIIGYTVNGGTGRELYRSSGITGNCDLILDINPGTANGVGTTSYMALGNVFFTADSGTTGSELWKTNGTTAGTSLVSDINPGLTTSNPRNFATLGTDIYFSANNGTNGAELWKSDGTTAGTVQVLDINVGATGSTPERLTTIGSKLYYFAADNASGADLYVYDGTTNLKLLDLNATVAAAYITNFVAIGSLVYFAVDSDDADTKRELWQTNGTAIGTVPVVPLSASNQNAVDINNITLSNGKLFFSAEVSDGVELFSYTPINLSTSKFNQQSVNVSPNPTTGIINVSNNSNLLLNYRLFDVVGKSISSGKVVNNQLEINADKGIYFLELSSDQGTVTKKIIKN